MEEKLMPFLKDATRHPRLLFSDTLASSSNSGMSPFQEKLIKLGIKEVDIGHYYCDGKRYLLVNMGWPVRSHYVLKVPMELAVKVLALGFFSLDMEA